MASKKEYIFIAEVLKNADIDGYTRNELISRFGEILMRDNPRFNYDLFRKASTPDPEPIVFGEEEW